MRAVMNDSTINNKHIYKQPVKPIQENEYDGPQDKVSILLWAPINHQEHRTPDFLKKPAVLLKEAGFDASFGKKTVDTDIEYIPENFSF